MEYLLLRWARDAVSTRVPPRLRRSGCQRAALAARDPGPTQEARRTIEVRQSARCPLIAEASARGPCGSITARHFATFVAEDTAAFVGIRSCAQSDRAQKEHVSRSAAR
ncbi:MAG TPA: hypothetical protein VEK07_21845 [Polyangiaceae bacterium]|nr:hypothetical protein [Polyangiaceae bacterium]